MIWVKVTVKTESKKIEWLAEMLAQERITSIEIQDENDFNNFIRENREYWDSVDDHLVERFKGKASIIFYLEENDKLNERLTALEKSLGLTLETEKIESIDWEEEAKKNYPPIEINDNFSIVPYWLEDTGKDRQVLKIDPGKNFGTGSHPTTKMCLDAISAMYLSRKTVLDIGSGSGILGLSALIRGAEHLTAWDIDEHAEKALQENAELNNIESRKIEFHAGDFLKQPNRTGAREQFDLILANIVSVVILKLISNIREALSENGVFLCSGIKKERGKEIEAALKKEGFTILETKSEEEWLCYLSSRRKTSPYQKMTGLPEMQD